MIKSILCCMIALLSQLLFLAPATAQASSSAFMYMTLHDNGQAQIITVDPVNHTSMTKQTQLFPAGMMVFASPMWVSPTKEWVAIDYSQIYVSNTLRLFNLKSGEIRDVTHNNLALLNYDPLQQGVSWSHDGRYLAFSEFIAQQSTETAYIYDVVQNKLIKLNTNEDQPYLFVWSSDSTSLIIQGSKGNSASFIDLLDINTNTVKQTINISDETYNICNLQLSPDGHFLAFVSTCDLTSPTSIQDVYMWDIQANKLFHTTTITSKMVALPPGSGNIASNYHLFWLSNTELLIGMFITDDLVNGNPLQILQTVKYNTSQSKLSVFSSGEVKDLAIRSSDGAIALSVIPSYTLSINKLGALEGTMPTNANIKITSAQTANISFAPSYIDGTSLSWSPDGKMLAYQQTGTNNFVFVTDGSPPAVSYTFSDSSVAADSASKTAYILPIGWLPINATTSMPTASPVQPTPTGSGGSAPGGNQING